MLSAGTGRVWTRKRGSFATLSCVVALLCLAAIPAAAGAAPMYWGATVKGETYGMDGEAPTNPAVMSRFEADAGKNATFVNTAGSWLNFNPVPLEAALSQGQIPLVTMPLGNSSLAKVISGEEDQKIREWARAAKAFGYPFLFRPWWEVNGNWYPWGRSPEYIAAWRHFHELVIGEGATNVTWAWVVNTIWFDPGSDPTPYYPGSAYVDWVGVDAYNWGYNPLQTDHWVTAEESIQPTLSVLHSIAPEKPVCICESASTEIGHGGEREHKPLWIHEMLTEYLPSHPEIKAYLWFNWNIKPDGKSERYDWPIESTAASQQSFREGIASPMYISQLPTLTKLAKVPLPSPFNTTDPNGAHAFANYEPASKVAKGAVTGPSRLSFGKPRFDRRHGTARIVVSVPGSGKLKLSGAGVRVRILPARSATRSPLRKRITGAKSLTVVVGAAGSKRHTLKARGRVRVRFTALFRPSAGEPQRSRLDLTLRHR